MVWSAVRLLAVEGAVPSVAAELCAIVLGQKMTIQQTLALEEHPFYSCHCPFLVSPQPKGSASEMEGALLTVGGPGCGVDCVPRNPVVCPLCSQRVALQVCWPGSDPSPHMSPGTLALAPFSET